MDGGPADTALVPKPATGTIELLIFITAIMTSTRPQDQPHIYLKIGDASEIVCPYCSTLFRFDPSLGAHEADPADCAYGVMD